MADNWPDAQEVLHYLLLTTGMRADHLLNAGVFQKVTLKSILQARQCINDASRAVLHEMFLVHIPSRPDSNQTEVAMLNIAV